MTNAVKKDFIKIGPHRGTAAIVLTMHDTETGLIDTVEDTISQMHNELKTECNPDGLFYHPVTKNCYFLVIDGHEPMQFQDTLTTLMSELVKTENFPVNILVHTGAQEPLTKDFENFMYDFHLKKMYGGFLPDGTTISKQPNIQSPEDKKNFDPKEFEKALNDAISEAAKNSREVNTYGVSLFAFVIEPKFSNAKVEDSINMDVLEEYLRASDNSYYHFSTSGSALYFYMINELLNLGYKAEGVRWNVYITPEDDCGEDDLNSIFSEAFNKGYFIV